MIKKNLELSDFGDKRKTTRYKSSFFQVMASRLFKW